jgi:BirA family biotin operon repressor/biotin-[acetyl-CoA-carboxylase] ligase
LARRILDEYSNDGHPAPSVDVVAWGQDAGRGRADRSWSSPAGQGIYVTAIRRLPSPQSLQLLPIAVGIALAETLDRYLAASCRLKWPNDLYCRGKKVGGILIDTLTQGSGGAMAMIGFGVNYGAELKTFGETGATSCQKEAEDLGVAANLPCMADLTQTLLARLDLRLAEEPGPGAWLDTYRRLSLHRPGDAMRCRVGAEWVEGRFAGFDALGLLRLDVVGSERRLAVADLLQD